MHYLITGHTGFKGSWLSLMLEMQGHTVSGISLDPQEKSLFNQANLGSILHTDLRIDIRDKSKLNKAVKEIDPEVIIHLAAQPLVREAYKKPIETFETNVIGTLNLLEATVGLNNLKASLIVTTDKVYKNRNLLRGYVETDELGGEDPYSASKAAADIAAQSWRKSYANSPIAIARAGNVIGGGDWAQDRIVPDLVNAYVSGKTPSLRYPEAVRPWQHVLDCLNGYLTLIDSQLARGTVGEWNFGPALDQKRSVRELVEFFARSWEVENEPWILEMDAQPHESGYLLLDSSKATSDLAWREVLSFEESIAWTVAWYKNLKNSSILELTKNQISNFKALKVM
jgi:CDP-glucose 4,6-dehydratase